jgi:hypothetical protein
MHHTWAELAAAPDLEHTSRAYLYHPHATFIPLHWRQEMQVWG